MRFSERMQQIGTSGIRDFFDKGKRIANSIDLSIGMADFDVPEPIKAATIQAIQEGCGTYSVTQGHAAVVEATRQYARSRYGLGDVIASNASHRAEMREMRGMSSRASPSG